MRNAVSIPILNIVDETVKRLKKEGSKKTGLLASQCSLENDLYGKYFRRNDISYFEPDKEEVGSLTKLISQVMTDKVTSDIKESVIEIIRRFEEKNVDSIVIGCTELPLAIDRENSTVKVYNTLTILAEATLEKAYGEIIV